MNIAVIGTGYVGQVAGVGFAEMGNTVRCVDVDADKVAALNGGTPTIYEAGLQDLLQRNLRSERITFSTDMAQAVQGSEIVFLAVGTPPSETGGADCSQIDAAAEMIGDSVARDIVVVNKSTVPVGTAERVEEIIRSRIRARFESGSLASEVVVDVVSNPEFLREGAAVKDFLNPDRVIVGAASDRARDVMEQLYQPIVRADRPMVVMDRRSAELTKYAANTFLATKISFINEMAQLCEAVDADVAQVARGMGLDHRIGARFLHAGIGWGGSCFPKDVSALQHTARMANVPLRIVDAAVDVNVYQQSWLLRTVLDEFATVAGATIAIWGLAFKPRTDDVRTSPAMTTIRELLDRGAFVRIFDPVAMENAERVLGPHARLTYAESMIEAVQHADALCIATEWDAFRSPDFSRMADVMQQTIILDGRNIYHPATLEASGWTYRSIGRPRVHVAETRVMI
jgi:UDPglucose 6-dehydrogenase